MTFICIRLLTSVAGCVIWSSMSASISNIGHRAERSGQRGAVLNPGRGLKLLWATLLCAEKIYNYIGRNSKYINFC